MAEVYRVSMFPAHPVWDKWLTSAQHGSGKVKVKRGDVEGLPAGKYAFLSVAVADNGPATTFLMEPVVA